MSVLAKESAATPISMDDGDRQAIGRLLMARNKTKIISGNTTTGNITAAAVYLLMKLHHFLVWKEEDMLRSPQEVAGILDQASDKTGAERCNVENLPHKILTLLDYSLYTVINDEILDVYGMNMAIKVAIYTLTDYALTDFMTTLNWTVTDKFTGDVILNINGPADYSIYGDARNSSIPDGFMAAMLLYPQLQHDYHASLDNVSLIPEYDSRVQIRDTDSNCFTTMYRMLIPTSRFSGNYINDINKINRMNRQFGEDKHQHPTVFDEGYMYFDSLQFIQGMLAMTSIIDVQQPWRALDIQEDGKWVATQP